MRLACAGLALAAVVLAGCFTERSPGPLERYEVVREDVVKITEAEWSVDRSSPAPRAGKLIGGHLEAMDR